MRGELDFAESLHARVARLAGLPATVLDEVRDEIVLTPGARTLVRTLKRLGDTVALVSGGFLEIVGPVARRDLGIDHVLANRLEVATGADRPRRRRDRRPGGQGGGAAAVRGRGRAAACRGRWPSVTAPTTSTCSLPPGLGIAFNAKPLVREQADTSVNVPYLDAVLFLLGITREDVEEADADAGTPTPAPPVISPGNPTRV
jgi:phosphoserine phosphatase